MNPLFNVLGGQTSDNGMLQMVQQFRQFQQNFKGDPKAEVQRLVQSGKISQSQLDQAQQMARQLQQYLH